ncbi:hypothetical protein CVIRNUC_005103 [Coccomyxa viridis]|uniref:Uncharacterized protein n=1 Tax=Coccomyxa viridis TaxID=1274662 RepID=A0AAV1I791_9CHLO|nr:hypothetical protein CVIRNUC_005103 [Coccomyxa viridis]
MRGAVITLLAATAITLGGVYYIHESQKQERKNLHRGVLRDEELYKMKLREQREQQELQQHRSAASD